MMRLLLGVLVTCAAAWIVAIAAPPGAGRFGASSLGLAWILIALPALVAWLVAETVHVVRPRRHFTGRRRATLRLFVTGAGAGLAALTLAAVGLAFLDDYAPDAAILATAFALATLAALLTLPRHRRGSCLYCAYDLRAVTAESLGRCPECGAKAA